MTSPSDQDSGPLAWVKGEIDLALERTEEALKAALDAPDRGARLQFAQTHLHQVRGALAIVGLDGLTVFSDNLDRLLAELARDEKPYTAEAAALCLRCLAALGNYLDELSHGVPDRALRLLPLLREVSAFRGIAEPSPAELFFPDLGARLPRRAALLLPAEAATRLQHDLKHLRARYQAGLLALIKHAAAPKGRRQWPPWLARSKRWRRCHRTGPLVECPWPLRQHGPRRLARRSGSPPDLQPGRRPPAQDGRRSGQRPAATAPRNPLPARWRRRLEPGG